MTMAAAPLLSISTITAAVTNMATGHSNVVMLCNISVCFYCVCSRVWTLEMVFAPIFVLLWHADNTRAASVALNYLTQDNQCNLTMSHRNLPHSLWCRYATVYY